MTNETPTGPEVQSQGATDRPGGNPSNLDDPSRVAVGFPSGAVESIRAMRERVRKIGGQGLSISTADVDEVLAWIDRYVPTSRPDMELSLGNDVGELVIEDPDLEVELIRFNGRTFVPETPTIVEHDVDRELLEDLVDDWIGGSFDADWTSRDGARAVLDELEREGLRIVRLGPVEDHNPDGFRHASPEVERAIADAVEDQRLRRYGAATFNLADMSGAVGDLLSAIRSAVGELASMGHSCGNSLRALSTLRAALPDPVICDACKGSGEGVADTICGKCGGSGGIPLEAITSPGVAAGFAGRSRSSGRGGKSATLLGGAE